DGPKVRSLGVAPFSVQPGVAAQQLLGTLDASATAVGIEVAGDRGWWLLLAGVRDVNLPTLPTFTTEIAFSRTIAPGPAMLRARAVDTSAHFGPVSTLPITVMAAPAPSARLVVTLSWASNADLDLHVVEPSGFE